MKHYWQLFKANFSISASVMMIYRANFLFYLLFESFFLASYFITMDIGFDMAGGQIKGWTKNQGFLLASATGLSHQLFITFFVHPLFSIPYNIWNGHFDYVLLKPVKVLPAILSTTEISVSNIPNLLINLILTSYFLSQTGEAIGVYQVMAFFIFILVGVAVRVALALLVVAPGFIGEKLTSGEQSYWSLTSIANFPLSAFPGKVEFILTYVIPIASIAYLPAQLFFQEKDLFYSSIALVCSLVFCFLCWKVFLRCMKEYKSTNAGLGL